MSRILYCSKISQLRKTLSECDRSRHEVTLLCGGKVRLSLPHSIAPEFVRGYRSGIARLAKGSYNLPQGSELSAWERGARFAFLAHWHARIWGMEEWPDLVFIQDTEK